MITRTVRQIEQMVSGKLIRNERSERRSIEGVSIDTRSIQAGNLFIPIKGERFNGHHFLQKAIEQGAAAALWHEDEPLPAEDLPLILVPDTLVAIQELAAEYRRQLSVRVIGITGSNGKTSTKDILAALLSTQFRTQKTHGNLNNHLGVPLTLLALEEQTEMAVVEMGMSGLGEIEKLAAIAKPDVAVITNIGEAHLTDLKTKENILQAKLEILSGLEEHGLFVYNGDDPYLKRACNILSTLAEWSSTVKLDVQTYGSDAANRYVPSAYFIEENGISFTLHDEECPTLFLPLLGKHQMYNALAAIAVARYFGVSYENIRQGLLQIEATGMRNELIKGEQFTLINDSYKSNPSSLRAALETLYQLKGYRQKIVLLGDMNGIGHPEQSVQFHREIGSELDARQIHYLFTVGRYAEHIAQAARARFSQQRIFSFKEEEQDALLYQLNKHLDRDSILLVKSSRELQLEKLIDRLLKQETTTSV
jgi:UDP-N-acetylmuramoyl-tripeptide--D-alanyl-D-alanine ligase